MPIIEVQLYAIFGLFSGITSRHFHLRFSVPQIRAGGLLLDGYSTGSEALLVYEFGLPSPFPPEVIPENGQKVAYFHSEKMTFFPIFGAFLRDYENLVRKTEPIPI